MGFWPSVQYSYFDGWCNTNPSRRQEPQFDFQSGKKTKHEVTDCNQFSLRHQQTSKPSNQDKHIQFRGAHYFCLSVDLNLVVVLCLLASSSSSIDHTNHNHNVHDIHQISGKPLRVSVDSSLSRGSAIIRMPDFLSIDHARCNVFLRLGHNQHNDYSDCIGFFLFSSD